MSEKIMLQLENGKEVDLKEILTTATVEQLKEMGFPLNEEGKISMTSFGESKSVDQMKQEAVEESANFIKSVVLPSAQHSSYGVKQVTTAGGSMGATVPTELANAILEKKAKFAVLRSRAFAFSMSGPFDIPLEGDGVNGYWVGESDTADANLVTESIPTVVKKTLDDHYLAALVKVSWKLMNTSAYNIVNYISSLAGRKLAEIEEAAFVGGNGTGKPKGIRTETLVSVAQAGAGLEYADIVNLYFTLKPQYRQNAVFMTSSMGARTIVGLEDGAGRPIFAPGQPLDELFRKPMVESVDIPENLGGGEDTTEVYFGDPFYYWIKDGQDIQVATEQNIERLQTKVLVYQAVDGKLTHTEAFVKLTGVKANAGS